MTVIGHFHDPRHSGDRPLSPTGIHASLPIIKARAPQRPYSPELQLPRHTLEDATFRRASGLFFRSVIEYRTLCSPMGTPPRAASEGQLIDRRAQPKALPRAATIDLQLRPTTATRPEARRPQGIKRETPLNSSPVNLNPWGPALQHMRNSKGQTPPRPPRSPARPKQSPPKLPDEATGGDCGPAASTDAAGPSSAPSPAPAAATSEVSPSRHWARKQGLIKHVHSAVQAQDQFRQFRERFEATRGERTISRLARASLVRAPTIANMASVLKRSNSPTAVPSAVPGWASPTLSPGSRAASPSPWQVLRPPSRLALRAPCISRASPVQYTRASVPVHQWFAYVRPSPSPVAIAVALYAASRASFSRFASHPRSPLAP